MARSYADRLEIYQNEIQDARDDRDVLQVCADQCVCVWRRDEATGAGSMQERREAKEDERTSERVLLVAP